MNDAHIIKLLNGDGVRTNYVMEKLGARKMAATKYLRGLGARYCRKAKMWRLPNVKRLKNNDFLYRSK